MGTDQSKPIDYKEAGVDIEAGDALVDFIKEAQPAKKKPGVLGGIGGFGAFFELPWADYKQPVLVSGTDGCGTKLRLAIETGEHTTVGIDLVAMCVNDIITSGAKPLFFLDYYATASLDLDVAQAVIYGIQAGCEQGSLALVGGETAEMPGMYKQGDYDLAGFAVGIVEKSLIIDGRSTTAGDVLIAIGSSGLHANGFSLVRRVCERAGIDWAQPAGDESDRTWGELLLEPTRIYVDAVTALIDALPVHALAHITGGGIAGNLQRVLPDGLCAQINTSSWEVPWVFKQLAKMGPIAEPAMRETFNLGIGMIAIVPQEMAAQAVEVLEGAGESAWVCGQVVSQPGTACVVLQDA